jgi:uncharacterized protein YjbI with pentapeptide repeats
MRAFLRNLFEELQRRWDAFEFPRLRERASTLVGLALAVALVVASIWVLREIPRRQVNEMLGPATAAGNALQRQALENEVREPLIEWFWEACGLIVLYFVWRRVQAADQNTRLIEAGHMTACYTTAVAQLAAAEAGQPNLEVRLGGIYALEKIARESPRDHWMVMEVLSAYVRRHAPAPPPSPAAGGNGHEPALAAAAESLPPATPGIDIQAILTVLGRRERDARREPSGRSLNLALTDLEGADFSQAHLEKANLHDARLERANFTHACLDGADLRGARLERANLMEASLERAELGGAHLQRANLMEARLERAYLMKAHLEDANLMDARLEGAYLILANLESANLQATRLEGAKLMAAHLERANLLDARLEKAELGGAHLEGAVLRGAELSGANLRRAHLEDANLTEAYLERAILMGAHLEGSALCEANLEGAYLYEAHFDGADLRGACLERASGLSVEQVKAAQNWASARYDHDFRQMLDEDETPPQTPAASGHA